MEKGIMEQQQIKDSIDQLRDRIRQAPEGTPHRKVYEWYVKIDELEQQLENLQQEHAVNE